MISIRRLEFTYPDGQFVLQIPELELQESSVVFAGPSGSGKTTLLHLIAGILASPRAEINVAGFSLNSLSDAERRVFRLRNVGLVFQDFQLIDYLNVVDNVLLPCRIHSEVRTTPAIRERATSLLESVGLADKLQRSIVRLSQGERQRVAICRALLLSPKVVLADEPTGNLDPENAERIVRLLLEETKRAEARLLMVTHDHSLLPLFDRVVSFEDFRRRVDGSSSAASTTASTSNSSEGAGR